MIQLMELMHHEYNAHELLALMLLQYFCSIVSKSIVLGTKECSACKLP
jgi:hypothetical protein